MINVVAFASLLLNVIVVAMVIVLLRKVGRLSNEASFVSIEKAQDKLERNMREDLALIRQEIGGTSRQNREELSGHLQKMNQSLLVTLGELTKMNEQKLERVRGVIEQRLTFLQEDNNKKLEQMRETVDEKLHATLEKRLGESFQQVSERLEQVHKGLGEMQSLASGVGDLKRVLTNVKTRGTMGEIQLGNLLEQLLSYEQYEANAAVRRGSAERVEYAVKLPAKDEENGTIFLPIDSKFPLEDYQRLLDAQEAGDAELAGEAAKQLEARIKLEARSIRDKYIHPPMTTDFAILFLPIEGLFAEVLRRPGLWDTLQREYRVIITGPTTLAAFLNSLQMGFRTLAIQKRSSEVWQLLGAVKTEFGKFGDILDKTKKKLQEATNTMDDAATRSRAIERRLRNVQELPAADSGELLGELELASSGSE
jgi:DNA recombination protein RmuC